MSARDSVRVMRTAQGVAMGAAVAVSVMLTAACSPYRVTRNPPPPLDVPGAYHGAGHGGPGDPATGSAGERSQAGPEQWWTDFGDPTLNQLVERTLRDNFQIRAAWARVEQGRALVAQANSGKFPQIDASVTAARQKSRFNFGQEVTFQVNQFSASVAAGYEVDLWRRMANQGDAAALDALAFRDDLESIAISLAGEVTEAWFDLINQRAQRKLIEEQLTTNETYLDLVRLRFEKGLASALEVYQQRQQLVTTRAQLAQIDSAIALFEHRLAVLVGQVPGAVTEAAASGDQLPGMPVVPRTGIPADLLDRRPDVRAARRRVEAADYRVAVAVADRLPSLRLSGSTSLQSATIADFIATPLWSILASVAAPIFDGGRREAEVERQKAVVEERLMGYGQVLLQAMVEVENALSQEKHQLVYIGDLEEAVEVADATLREAQARYRQGLVDYLPVLTSLQGKQRTELSLLQARRQLLSIRVQLCRALGGTWTRSLKEPERPERSRQAEPGEADGESGNSTAPQREGESS